MEYGTKVRFGIWQEKFMSFFGENGLLGHSRTYQPKLYHYVTNIGYFWFIGDICGEIKNPLGADLWAFEIWDFEDFFQF